MKIRYLQATHDAESGEIREMEEVYANVLILLGYAEAYNEAEETPSDDSDAQAATDSARDYAKMKVAELKAELEKYGVTPPSNATKADLIDLLKQFDVMAD